MVKLPLKVTFVSDKLIGESFLVRLAESVLPYGPVKVAVVEVFLIPLGWETTNSKDTLVFAAINSTSLGVKVKDSTTGRTLALAIAGVSANARTAAISIDLIFMSLPN